MEENAKIQILANDLVRRLLNTKRQLAWQFKTAVIDDYGQKLLNSGYGRAQVVRIIVAGIKGYERKVQRCVKEGRQLYRTAKESSASRSRKKITEKSEWFRIQKNKEQEEQADGERGGTHKCLEIKFSF